MTAQCSKRSRSKVAESFCVWMWTTKAVRINTKEHRCLDFSFSGYSMIFFLFRIYFKAMWNLLNKWQLILEEDLSKYLHVRRREQKVAILERFFYQKLSKSIFIRIIRILSANRKVKSPNSHNYYFLSLLKTAISIQRLLLIQHKLTSLLPGMPRLITQRCFKPLKERKNKEYF